MLKKFLKIKKLLGQRGSGNFGSLLLGSGTDLSENREYSPGDEKRSINRRMSAKYDQLFVNLFHGDKTIDVHLCCDVNYNRKGENTKSFLSFFAGLTTYFGAEKAHITGRIGDDQYIQLEKLPYQKSFLEDFLSETRGLIPTYNSSLIDILNNQLSLQKRRLIIIVSDFLSYGEEEKRIVNILRQKNEVRLIQLPTHGTVINGALLLEKYI